MKLMSDPDLDMNLPVMCIYFPDGSVVVGIRLRETDDSFLVGCTARLTMDKDKKVGAESVSAQPVLRFFKSAIRYTVLPTEMTVYYYFTFLQSYGYTNMPDYFTDERKDYLETVVADSKYNVQKAPEPPLVHNASVETPEVPGESPFSFTPHTQSESIH
jgi:hypothetical protein